MSGLIIEILPGRNTAVARTIKANTPDAKTFYTFQAYAHMGGAFPVEIKIPAESATHCLAVGCYELGASSYKVGQFGDLEIDRYNLTLMPVLDDVFGKKDEFKKAI